jgi:hypothetical protein
LVALFRLVLTVEVLEIEVQLAVSFFMFIRTLLRDLRLANATATLSGRGMTIAMPLWKGLKLDLLSPQQLQIKMSLIVG